MVLAGPIEFHVPSDNQPHPVTGECTAHHDYSLFAVWPHMHKFGTHQKVELVSGAGATTMIHDAPFRFDDQSYQAVSPMSQVHVGDKVRLTCTHVNSSGTEVTHAHSFTLKVTQVTASIARCALPASIGSRPRAATSTARINTYMRC